MSFKITYRILANRKCLISLDLLKKKGLINFKEDIMLGGIGVQELLLIFLVLLLLFGAKKIPEIAKGLGKSVKEFKKGVHEIEEEIKREEGSSEDNKKIAG